MSALTAAIKPVAFAAPVVAPRYRSRTAVAMSLAGKHVVVTGASRGIGRGLAIALGEQRATVYITGRRPRGDSNSLEETAAMVRAAGGTCVPMVCDHSDDADVKAFFADLSERLDAGAGGKLDAFVNNAYAAVPFLTASRDVPFWNKNTRAPGEADPNSNPGEVWDLVNNVGLRNNYVCAARAIRLMEPYGGGLIVNITSWGGVTSLFDVCYSVGKDAGDRLSAEIAKAAPPGIQCFSLCPGFVSTESLLQAVKDEIERCRAEGKEPQSFPVFNAESPLFVGRVLAEILSKPPKERKSMNGKIVIAAEAAKKYGVRDENGFRPLSGRSLRCVAQTAIPFLVDSPLRFVIPNILIPFWLLFAVSGMSPKLW